MIGKQFIKFCVIGLLATAVNYGLFYVLYEFAGLDYLLSSAIGFLAGTLVGYQLNRLWTFNITEKNIKHLYKYLTVYTCSLFAGLGFLKFFVTYLGIDPKLAGLLVIGITTIINFGGSKFWIFKD